MSATDSHLRHEYQPGTPSLLRALNERTLLEYLRSHQPTSRAQLARATGLSKPTVSQALASLEVEEGRAAQGLRMLVVCDRERIRLGAPLFVQDEIEDRDQSLAAAHAALGADSDSVIEEARGVPLETVVDDTLKLEQRR